MRTTKWPSLKKKRAMPGGFYSNPHRHGCSKCNALVPNCKCQTPDVDPLCVTCWVGRLRPWWPHAERPFDCCRAHARKVHEAECNSQLLAGTRTWWRCEACRRFQPFDPSDPANDPPIDLGEWVEKYGVLPKTPLTAAQWSAKNQER